MRNLNADRRLIGDVEVTLTEGEIVESRLATLNPQHRIPNEVYAAGPAAVAAYQDFLARTGDVAAPRTVEHIEISSFN